MQQCNVLLKKNNNHLTWYLRRLHRNVGGPRAVSEAPAQGAPESPPLGWGLPAANHSRQGEEGLPRLMPYVLPQHGWLSLPASPRHFRAPWGQRFPQAQHLLLTCFIFFFFDFFLLKSHPTSLPFFEESNVRL